MAYDRLDHRQLHVQPLAARKSKHHLDEIRRDPDATPPDPGAMAPAIAATVAAIRAARASGAAVILAYGAHLVKNGLGPVVARLVQEGWVTHLATTGAGTNHDWEYAYGGRSEEDVRSHVAAGCFGTWDETGRYIHLAVLAGAVEGMGYGESLGRFIAEDGDLFTPHTEDGYSLAWEIADGSIAEVEYHAEDGAWAFHIVGVTEGKTTMKLKIMHEGHADFVSRDIEIHVTEGGPGEEHDHDEG